jgi:hypothetical protein
VIDGRWIQESTQRVARGLRVWGGQWIFVSPRHHLVVVSTGNNDDNQSTAAAGFLFSHVLPAVME